MENDVRMFPAEVAEKLNIAVVTLRKYSDIYESIIENDNHFTRTKTKGRTYSDIDIEFFKEVIRLKGDSDTPNKPVESIMKELIESKEAVSYDPTYTPKNDDIPNDIALQTTLNTQLEVIEGQKEVVTSLLTLINEQHTQINQQDDMFRKQNELIEKQNANIEKLLNKLEQITEEQESQSEKNSIFSIFKRNK